jgi:transcriptional regulator with XRE-family HTH domain
MLKLKELRLKRGFTQQKMADLLNINQGAYSQLENERYIMNVQMLNKLADILECTTDELLGRTGSHDILEKNWQTIDNLLKGKSKD